MGNWRNFDNTPYAANATNSNYSNTALIPDLNEVKVRYRILGMICELSQNNARAKRNAS